MSRPKPRVLLETIDDNMSSYQVCEADAIYAVCYKGAPIKIKTKANVEIEYPGPKYSKTSFPTPGHAFNLVERLNLRFNTQDFTVVMMSVGRTITENKQALSCNELHSKQVITPAQATFTGSLHEG